MKGSYGEFILKTALNYARQNLEFIFFFTKLKSHKNLFFTKILLFIELYMIIYFSGGFFNFWVADYFSCHFISNGKQGIQNRVSRQLLRTDPQLY